MTDMLFHPDALVHAAGQPWVYAVVLLLCVLDGFFPPVPSEAVILALAYTVFHTGGADPWILFASAALGAFIGDNIAFSLGRRVGLTRFSWMRSAMMRKACRCGAKELRHRPVSMILVARFIPVGRVGVNLLAGAISSDHAGVELSEPTPGAPRRAVVLSRRKFRLITACSAALWAAYSMGIGALAGAWFDDNALLGILAAIAAAAVLGLLIDRISAIVARGNGQGTAREMEKSGTPSARVPDFSARA